MFNNMQFFVRALVLIGVVCTTVFGCCVVWIHNPHEPLNTLLFSRIETILVGYDLVAFLSSLVFVLLNQARCENVDYFMLIISCLLLIACLFNPALICV